MLLKPSCSPSTESLESVVRIGLLGLLWVGIRLLVMLGCLVVLLGCLVMLLGCLVSMVLLRLVLVLRRSLWLVVLV